MPTPKDAPYKLKQNKKHMVKLLQCPICKEAGGHKWGTLKAVTVDTPAGPKKFMIHADCLRKEHK